MYQVSPARTTLGAPMICGYPVCARESVKVGSLIGSMPKIGVGATVTAPSATLTPSIDSIRLVSLKESSKSTDPDIPMPRAAVEMVAAAKASAKKICVRPSDKSSTPLRPREGYGGAYLTCGIRRH